MSNDKMIKKLKQFLIESNANDFSKLLIVVLLILAGASLIAMFFVDPWYVIAADLVVLALMLVVHFIDFAFYLMIFFYPFVAWEFKIGALNLPYVDLLALLVFGAWLIKKLITWTKTNHIGFRDFPALGAALFFLVVSALSIINNDNILLGFRYWLRPLLFFYLMFIVLPYDMIKTQKRLFGVLRIMFIVGVAVMIMGLFSVATAEGGWFAHRAVPYSFWGFSPLGGNHNAIAEVLIVTIPIVLIFILNEQRTRVKNWLVLILGALMVTTILTYSRSGWLALLVEFIIILAVYYRKKWGKQLTGFVILCLIILPIIFYLSLFQNLNLIQLSNSNRLMSSQISMEYFAQHPVIGNGLNTFQKLLGSTFVYFVDFGDPLDSHGFAQKLLVETGALGLIGYLGILVYCFKKYIDGYRMAETEKSKNIILAFLMMLVALVVFELFSTSYFIARMWLPIGVGLAGTKILSMKNEQ
ncbi:MAG: O-antigen ligase family protein [Candidatus Falkowbacteria bacterium]